ncbi:MAG TPA: DUF11 domain-containing protein [Anaerolineae bacterium]|nr:DUF11 domain-containing protein [Anaerolineae bacterium]
MMKNTLRGFFALALLLALLLVGAPYAQADEGTPFRPLNQNAEELATYIIRLKNPSLAAYRGGIPGLAPTSPRVTGAAKLDVNSPASQAYLDFLAQQRKVFLQEASELIGRELNADRVFDVVYNGLTLQLTAQEAAKIATLPMVRKVQRDYMKYPLTDRGPEWIGAPSMWGPRTAADCTADGGTCGEGIIIGVIDTGINDGHPSFADVGDDGYDHTNPLGSGNYKGWCDPGNANYDASLQCNDKLIGMWDFVGDGNGPRDSDGHGSHTASTSAGNFIDQATLVAPTITFTRTISGVAPHANIIAYRACGHSGCPLSALTDAINQAVADGVDVINYSIGGPSSNPWTDDDAQAFLDAWDANIFVATSAGNSGPGPSTMGSPADAPWIMAVGASTHDRAFANWLTNMTTDQGTTLDTIEGRSITSGYGPAPIVYAGDYGNPLCKAGIWPSNQFNGEIVVCDRGEIARVDKSANVAAAGGGGMILANTINEGDGLSADAHSIPSVHITYKDGVKLKNWLANGDTGHTATIAGTQMDVDTKYGDHMASFSSRGPNPAAPDIIKPDIIGPGVDIFAAVADDGDPSNGPDYGVISGTSMSSPHLAGAGILMKQAHPGWSPDQIKSAIMTTSKHSGLTEADGATPTTPFSAGAGRVALENAKDAAMLLEETRANYDNTNPDTGGDPTTLNIASMGDGACYQTCSWTRTVTNPTSQAMNWTGVFTGTNGLVGTLSPSTLAISPNGSASFTLSVDVTGLQPGEWYFGEVVWTEDNGLAPDAHFPVAVKVATSTDERMIVKTVDLSGANSGDTLDYTVTIKNYATSAENFTLSDPIPAGATYVSGSATGGWTYDSGTNTLNWSGTLNAAQYVVEEQNRSGFQSIASTGIPIYEPGDGENVCYLIPVDFWYVNKHYGDMIMSANGVVRAGIGPLQICPPTTNQQFPTNDLFDDWDNLIAPFWTDLDPESGGQMYYESGVMYNGKPHYVLEWNAIPLKSDPNTTATFQMWIEKGSDNVWFAYPSGGPLNGPTTPDATIGGEDETGTLGANYYYNGSGTMPDGSVDVWVGLKPATKTFGYQATVTASAGNDVINEAEVTVNSDTNQAMALTHICDNNVAAADAMISYAGDKKYTSFDWSLTGDIYVSYQLWRSESPYFTPGDAGTTLVWEGHDFSTIDYDSDFAIGNPDTNYYYQLRTLNCTGTASSDDNQSAEFDFALVPGTN